LRGEFDHAYSVRHSAFTYAAGNHNAILDQPFRSLPAIRIGALEKIPGIPGSLPAIPGCLLSSELSHPAKITNPPQISRLPEKIMFAIKPGNTHSPRIQTQPFILFHS
jgi:hypothetical protein